MNFCPKQQRNWKRSLTALAGYVLVVSCASSVSRAVAPTAFTGRSSNWAILIGVDELQQEELPQKKGAEEATNELAETLRVRYGYADGNLVLLRGRAATRSRVISELEKLSRSTRAGDTVFIYFDGYFAASREFGDHGPAGRLALIPFDGRLNAYDSLLSLAELSSIVRSRMAAQEVLVIVNGLSPERSGRLPVESRSRVAYSKSDGSSGSSWLLCLETVGSGAGPIVREQILQVLQGSQSVVSVHEIERSLAMSTKGANIISWSASATPFRFRESAGSAWDRVLNDDMQIRDRMAAIDVVVQQAGPVNEVKSNGAAVEISFRLLDLAADQSQSAELRQKALAGIEQLRQVEVANELAQVVEEIANPAMKLAGLRALVGLDPKLAAPLLRDSMGSDDQTLSRFSLQAIGRIEDRDSLDAIIEMISDGGIDDQLLPIAIQVISGFTEKSPTLLQRLRVFLTDERADVRLAAVRMISQQDTRNTFTELLVSLYKEDPDPRVRIASAYALGFLDYSQLRDEEVEAVFSALVDGISDDHPDIRKATIFALGQSGRREAVKPVITALLESLDSQPESAVSQFTMIDALGHLRSEQAVPLIVQLLENRPELSPQGRFAAAEALGRIGHVDGRDALVELSNDKVHYVAAAAKRALRQLEQAGLRDVIVDNSVDVGVRVAAILNLAAKGEAEDIQLLIDQLKSSNAKIRDASIDGLGNFAEPIDSGRIVAGIQDNESLVRQGFLELVARWRAEPEFVQVIADKLPNETNRAVRCAMIHALGAINSSEASVALMSLVEQNQATTALELQALATALTEAGRRALATSDWKRAIEWAEQARRVQSTLGPYLNYDSEPELLMAKALALQGESEKAEEVFRKALLQRPDDVGPWNLQYAYAATELGVAYRDASNFELSEKHLLESLSILQGAYGPNSPQSAPVLRELILLYSKTNDRENADLARQTLRNIESRQKTVAVDYWRNQNWLDDAAANRLEQLLAFEQTSQLNQTWLGVSEDLNATSQSAGPSAFFEVKALENAVLTAPSMMGD